jgi:hypothetical protein
VVSGQWSVVSGQWSKKINGIRYSNADLMYLIYLVVFSSTIIDGPLESHF